MRDQLGSACPDHLFEQLPHGGFRNEDHATITNNTFSLPDSTPAQCPFSESRISKRAATEAQPAAVKKEATFVALSKFVIANGLIAEVKEAFRARPHLVDDSPGFLRMEVISPVEKPEEIWLMTFWTDGESYKVWHHSHLYHESHKGIPKGLKLVPGETKIRTFEHVAS